MAQELIGVETYEPSFLCGSWAEQYSVHGWKYVSDMATTAVPGTAAPQTHCRDGGLFKSPCLLLSSRHISLTIINRTTATFVYSKPSSVEKVLLNAMTFLPPSCPCSTSFYPSCYQNVPHLGFFTDFFHPLRTLYELQAWALPSAVTDILNPMHLPGSSIVLGFEHSLLPTEVSIH